MIVRVIGRMAHQWSIDRSIHMQIQEVMSTDICMGLLSLNIIGLLCLHKTFLINKHPGTW